MYHKHKDRNGYPLSVKNIVRDDYGRHWFVEEFVDDNSESTVKCRNGNSFCYCHHCRLEHIL